MGIRNSPESFRRAADEAVNSDDRQLLWGVFDRYEVRRAGGSQEFYFYAPVDFPEGLPGGKEPFWLTINPYLRNPWTQDQGLTLYSPLNVPGLFLEFASLVEDPGLDEEPHTKNNEAVALDWISAWGVLGLTPTGFDSLTRGRIHPGGEEDSLSSFVEQAGFANTTLRLYEAATAPEGPDIDFIQRGIPEEKWDYYAQNPVEAKTRALTTVAELVQLFLEEYCSCRFHVQKDGKVNLAWHFNNLLGAMWIQMMWLLMSTDQTRCARQGCAKIITFEPGQPPPELGTGKNRRGRYKTRSDKKFCTALCRVKNHQQKQRGQGNGG